jgi:hypothetical protein
VKLLTKVAILILALMFNFTLAGDGLKKTCQDEDDIFFDENYFPTMMFWYIIVPFALLFCVVRIHSLR